jgi:hypothetical protein
MAFIDVTREKRYRGLKVENEGLTEELRALRWEKKIRSSERPYSAQGMLGRSNNK